VTIEAGGARRRILVKQDALAEQPKIDHVSEGCVVKTGTLIRVDWPETACFPPRWQYPGFSNDEDTGLNARGLLDAFAILNPNASIWLDGECLRSAARLPDRWCAHQATSPHWYDEQQLRALIAAYIGRERQGEGRAMSLREFVSTFAGLSGSKQPPKVLKDAAIEGLNLADLVEGEDLSGKMVKALLSSMQKAARPVKPDRLGAIGKDRLSAMLQEIYGAEEEGIEGYRILRGEAEGRPFVVEAAAELLPVEDERTLILGLNWTPCLSRHAFEDLDGVLAEAAVDWDDPVVLAVHVVTPYAAFTDRGKTRASLPRHVRAAIRSAALQVLEPYTRAKKKQRREERKLESRRRQRLQEAKKKEVTIKDAVFQVLEDAHRHVTGGQPGAPAHARQLMYAVRKRVLEITGGRCWENSATFTQDYLPEYMRANPQTTAAWNVVYDARGRLIEPHGGETVELGTLQVRRYTSLWHPGDYPDAGGPVEYSPPEVSPLSSFVHCARQGRGPYDLYRHVLLVEKQGFEDLLRHAGVADAFDVALATTKGHSTTAARELVDELSGLGVTTIVLHDFDLDGLKILHWLRNSGDRYTFRNKPLVVDIGLRLTDAQGMGLEGEPVRYGQMKKNPSDYLRDVGATEREVAFLVSGESGGRYSGRRVELNEMTNPQFLDFIRGKLTEAGVKKVVPKEQSLKTAFVKAARVEMVQHLVEQARLNAEAEAWKRFGTVEIKPPDDLAKQVAEAIEGKGTPWNQALALLVRKQLREQDATAAPE
jgi:hypothetical protein